MTLGEAKAKALKLMDEYTSRGAKVTDPDLAKKMNSLFDTAQKQISQVKRIVRHYEIPAAEGTYPMPDDFMALRKTWVDGKVGNIGYWVGNSIVIPKNSAEKVAIEYYAYPADITDATADEYVFEVTRDAQECMPYWVAAQPFIADNFVVEYKDLMAMYDRMVAALDARLPGDGAAVVKLWGWD